MRNNLAQIKIRGRLEPLIIDNERALKLKKKKFGSDLIQKAEPTDLIDLGEWSGEYSRIIEIEMTSGKDTTETSFDKQVRKEEIATEKWKKKTPEEKGRSIGRFTLAYQVRLCEFGTQPPEDVLKKVREIQTTFFESDAEATACPSELYEALLPNSKVKTLAEKMNPNNKQCGCGKKLASSQNKYCSGRCMLEDENGKLSTK